MTIFFIIKKWKWNLAIYFLLGMISGFLSITTLYIIKLLIDSIVSNGKYLFFLLLLMGFSSISIFFFYIKTVYNKILLIKLIEYLRKEKTNHLTTTKYYDSFNSGVIKSELLNNAPNIINGVVLGFFDIINTFIILIISLITLCIFHWIIFIIAISFAIISILASIISSKISAKYYLKVNTISNKYNADAKNIIKWRNKIHFMRKINFFNSLLLNLTTSKNSQIYQNYKRIIYYNVPVLILGFVMQLSAPIVSSILAKNGLVPISVIAVSGFIFGMVFSYIISLPTQLSNYINNKKLLEKYIASDNSFIKNNDNISEIKLIDFNPKIKNKTLFTNNINVSINKKSKIHIIGQNGSGKSTMFKSLMTNSNYDGHILINNQNTSYSLIDYKKIVFLNEYPHIFNTSVRKNITLFSQKYKDKEIKQIMNFVNLKMNLNKNISLLKISDGQRQKIALARALLIKPDYIFIDESLNNIAVSDRKKIHNLLLNLNIGIILISHKKIGGEYEKIKID